MLSDYIKTSTQKINKYCMSQKKKEETEEKKEEKKVTKKTKGFIHLADFVRKKTKDKKFSVIFTYEEIGCRADVRILENIKKKNLQSQIYQELDSIAAFGEKRESCGIGLEDQHILIEFRKYSLSIQIVGNDSEKITTKIQKFLYSVYFEK